MSSSTMLAIREFDSHSETTTPFFANEDVDQFPWMRPTTLRNAGLKCAHPNSNFSVMFEPNGSYCGFKDINVLQGDFLGTTIKQLIIVSPTLRVLRETLNDWESKIMKKENLLKFDTIHQGDITLILNVPLVVEPYIEDGEYILSIPELNIYVSSPNLDDVSDELQSDIIWLWNEYVVAQDENLSSDAEQLKKVLQNLVKEVR